MARTRAATFDQQRNAMLDAAADLFAERGYATASIADLARACGVSKGLLYHYYRDKEHLLFDIADRYIDTLKQLVADAAAEDRAAHSGRRDGAQVDAARLRALIARFMSAYRDSAARHRVLVQDVKYLSPRHRSRIRAKQRAVVDAVADAIALVAPHLAAPAAREAVLKPLTMTLFGMMNWTFTWLRDDGPLSYDDMAALVADLFLSGVAGVHDPRRPGAAPLRLLPARRRSTRAERRSGGAERFEAAAAE
jgi:AcrR family transcriptional regulator